jgi:copper chaperone CopZ
MAGDFPREQFVLIKIEGMHCHKCEQTIQRALALNPGVREVAVDFLSAQASVLFTRGTVSVRQLMDSVEQAGYHATGFSQAHVDPGGH